MLPHLARYAIERVSLPDDTVLDPFCGCGTVQIEALLAGRNSVGVDVNPLAVLLARAKTTFFDAVELTATARRIISAARRRRSDRLTPYRWLKYWFAPLTLSKLFKVRLSISSARTSRRYRELLFACLAVCVRKCSRADPRSPKPFISKRARSKRVGRHFDAFKLFLDEVQRLCDAMQDLKRRAGNVKTSVCTTCSDSRRSATGRSCQTVIDAVVTSPPYLTAQDYYRSSKLELAILGKLRDGDDQRLGAKIVGSGRGTRGVGPRKIGRQAPVQLRRLAARSCVLSSIVQRYLHDMRDVFSNVKNRLKHGGKCCLIVGDSTLSGVRLPVHSWIRRIAEQAGFKLIAHEKDLIRDRRLPPMRMGHKSLIDAEHLLFFELTSQDVATNGVALTTSGHMRARRRRNARCSPASIK